MKYIIFGKNGQLGKSVLNHLKNTGESYSAFDIEDADITNFQLIRNILLLNKPEIVINCTAYNEVDKAEIESEKAYNINSFAIKNFAEICNLIDCKFIHFSTDYVFDGTKNAPYNEMDNTNPLSVYGKSKLLGETFIQERFDNHLIFRLSWLYGNGEQNFIYKLLNWSKNNKELRIVDNEISVPTSTETVAGIVFEAVRKNLTGLYHLTNSGFASRYEWAMKIKDLYNLPNIIIPAKIEDFNLPAQRPLYSVMDNNLISNTLNINIESWQDTLKKYSQKI